MDYFQEIINSLDTNELKVMSILYDNDSVNTYQSISKTKIIEQSNMSDFVFRKVISRLEALLLVAVVKSSRFYRYYLTKNGIQAINNITEGAYVK